MGSVLLPEHILSYGLTFILPGLIAWALLRGAEPFAPIGEEVPVGIFVCLFEGVVPCCLSLIVGLATEYYGERELRQVAKRRQMKLTASEDGLVKTIVQLLSNTDELRVVGVSCHLVGIVAQVIEVVLIQILIGVYHGCVYLGLHGGIELDESVGELFAWLHDAFEEFVAADQL